MRYYNVYQQRKPILVDAKKKLYEPDLAYVGGVLADNGADAINRARVEYFDVFTGGQKGLLDFPIVEEVDQCGNPVTQDQQYWH